MRRQIGKALQVRGKAIQNALAEYNKLAKKMRPPAPELHWKDIMSYGFVGEFELIKYVWSRADISEAAWAQPFNREIAVKHFKVVRAHEELLRLHTEMRRIRAAIERDKKDFEAAVATLSNSDPLLAAELTSRYSVRSRVNAQLHAGLLCAENLPGYIGPSFPRPTATASSSLPDPGASGPLSLSTEAPQADDPESEEPDDEVGEVLESEGLEACLGASDPVGQMGIPAGMLYEFQL